MRVLMLGWEFPPFIAGGLGTACHGLTRALDRLGQDVLFVLPRSADGWSGSRVRVVGPNVIQQATMTARPNPSADGPIEPDTSFPIVEGQIEGFERARFVGVPAGFSHPYPGFIDPVTSAASSGVAGLGPAGPSATESDAL
ncbi:MAG: glycogen/starch synthase, partial [Planctomycetota bacterium]